jgi:hypothetical protein
MNGLPVRLSDQLRENPRFLWAFGIFGLAICIWLVAGSMIVIDSLILPHPTPTVAASSTVVLTQTDHPTTTVVDLMPNETMAITPSQSSPQTESPTLSPIPPTLVTEQASQASTTDESSEPNSAPTGCAIPTDWVGYTIEEGDTLFGFVLGSKGTLTVDAIMTSNCLNSKSLSVGQVIYLPDGVAEESPKVDNGPAPVGGSSGGSASADGLTRTAACPCTIKVGAGWRLEQIAEAVNAASVGFTGTAFMAAANAPADFGFLASKPSGVSLEGFMLPGSYTLDNTTTATQFRDMMLNAFGSAAGGLQGDGSKRGLTFWQTVVLASIVQRESYAPAEQKLIASVFYNRLAQGKGLAATVTLQYALGKSGNWWPRVRSVNFESPYNTYLNQGLPPSPIGSPTIEALMSTVYPADTNYLYFSGKCGGGGNFYAATFAEFEAGLKCK